MCDGEAPDLLFERDTRGVRCEEGIFWSLCALIEVFERVIKCLDEFIIH